MKPRYNHSNGSSCQIHSNGTVLVQKLLKYICIFSKLMWTEKLPVKGKCHLFYAVQTKHACQEKAYDWLDVYILCLLVWYTLSPAKGLDHIAENILSFLDAKSLCSAERVCKEWYRVISDGMLWKKLIERKVRTDALWKGLSERRGW